jgi:O-antigen/teichoic acid export membrane protein
MNRKKIIEFAIGPIGAAGLGFLLVPLMAWLFEPADIGRLNILNLMLSFILLSMLMGLDIAYVREYHETNNREKLLKACIAPGLVIGLIICVAFQRNIGDIFKIKNYDIFLVSILLALAFLFNFISRFLSLMLRMEEKGLAYSLSQILPKITYLILVLMVALFSIERSFSTILIITSVSMGVTTLLYGWLTREKIRKTISSVIELKDISKLIKFGAPLTMSSLMYWALTGTSSLAITKYSTLEELSVYSITISVAAAASIFQSIFTIVWSPIIFKWVKNGDDLGKIDSIAKQALAAICMIITIAGVFSFLSDYLLPNHYKDVKYLLVCAIIPSMFYMMSEITGMGITVARKTSYEMLVTGIALLLSIILNIWLVQKFGATGAVVANSIAYFIYYIGRSEFSARLWRVFPRKKIYGYLLIIMIFGIMTALNGKGLRQDLTLLWVAVLPIVFLIFKKEYFETYKYFVNR